MQILLIEDERPVAQAILRLLSDSGYQVRWTRTGTEGLEVAQSEAYDLIILDILLPGMSGWEVCRRLRESQVNTQLLILSAMDEPGDVTRGLDLGADDYLTKPFDPSELLSRVRARVRTGGTHLGRHIQIGDLDLDRVEHTVKRSGRTVALTPPEYAVLERLASDAGKPVSSDTLGRDVDFAPDPAEDPVDYCVRSLMHKIDGDDSVRLIHQTGSGYVLKLPSVINL